METNLLAIDPGCAKDGPGCAVALYRDEVLYHTWFERPSIAAIYLAQDTGNLDAVVWEIPQHDGRPMAYDTAIQLTAAGASLANMYAGRFGGRVIARTPRAWKGTLPKAITHKQMWDALTPSERAVLGGDATGRQIEAAVERGAKARWKPDKSHYYPAGWVDHNRLDAARIGFGELKRC